MSQKRKGLYPMKELVKKNKNENNKKNKTKRNEGKCTLLFCIVYWVSLSCLLKRQSGFYLTNISLNDHKRPHFLQRGVLKSVVKGPWKKLMNELISEEAISSQQLLNGCSCSVSRQFCDSTVIRVLRRHSVV